MQSVTEQPHARSTERFGNVLEERLRGPLGVLATFALLLALMVLLGYSLKQSIRDPAVMWPSAGLVFVAYWLSPLRRWPALLLVQLLVEFGVVAMLVGEIPETRTILYPLANGFGGVVAALLARWLVGDSTYLRTRHILTLMVCMAAGSLAAAIMVALVNTQRAGESATYLNQLQLSWMGDWLGAFTVAPMLFCWISPLRRKHRELALQSRGEVVVLFALVAGVCFYVFAAPAGGVTSLLQLPTAIAAVLLFASVRLPPRWVATLCAFTGLLCSWLAAMQQGPFAEASVFIRTVEVQTFLGTLTVVAFLMSISIAEKNVALGQLGESEYRYRSFVELSSEAVWRVELTRAMPVVLPVEAQVAWLREQGRVVEASRTYEQLDPDAHLLRPPGLPWRQELSWCAAYESHLAHSAEHGFSPDRIRLRMDIGGRARSFLAAYHAVVEDGCLQRIWGVARDVTELTDLNATLLREQERLKSYARRIVTTEETARRATAVDLHDDIGQSLVSMAMTLEVAGRSAPADLKLLVEEARTRLRGVQERTQHMISDLSPPGLYELGLVPALQWLVVYVRGHERLNAELESQVREQAVGLETRVLVFRLVREFLRNVVKHSGVNAARVVVQGDDERLRVEVSDQGRGFEWRADMIAGGTAGFGLWSISDRVNEAGGTFHVDTRPGMGTRIEMEFPLQRSGVSVATAPRS